MGVPEENVILLLNAGQVKMNTSISKMKLLAKISGGKAELIFYYAGHGLPDETSKEPYLIPVDVSGNNMSYAIKLKDVYKQLSEYPSERITIFLDACFSGGARDQALLAVRGVRIKPQEEAVSGRIIVFSASSGEQSASAYKEKTHGMFTYYLLKKMQETNGNVSYSELGNYINEKVSLKSVLVNEKEQNPQILFSPELQGKWESWTFN
ncbi:MAG: caspase family protein [bacterium]